MASSNVNSVFQQITDLIEVETEKLSNRIGLLGVRRVVETIDEHKVIAWADLRKSISYEVRRMTNQWLVKIYSGVKHAVYAHEGTRPHFPPVNKIAKWVRKKGIAGRWSVKSRRRLGNKMKKYDEDRQVAMMIARKIASKGTKGVRFFKFALKKLMPQIEKEIREFGFAS